MNSKEASHDEIWDDSALVDSWNEALDEYKKYHSVHAAGGAIEDIPGALKELETRWDAKPETTAHDDEPMEEEGERQDDSMPMSNETATISDAQRSDAKKFDPRTTGHDGGQASKAGPESHPGSGPAAFGPQTLLGSVQDEEMKKLLMSWYYAGYYTGLHEGRQQGMRQAESTRKGTAPDS
ncbi:survival motor neuron-like protein 1 [Diplogelasinospora grovesii]|uniref:Survival motor neuron-like protein 1 n=1 Tax=Diplogelasinospora grovesii TaxID=303347 RepID=A0AAN6NHX0_9PEZI|nr:survival motor neuron-like protein 1 [Diplogelasinospora grovesii]